MKLALGSAVLLTVALPAAAPAQRILPSQDAWPVWSPDGTRIAFTRISTGGMTLQLVDVATHRVRQVAANTYQLRPSWSPDGTRIAFQAHGAISVATVAGGVRRLGPGLAPAWRPGSDTVAYVRDGDLVVGAEVWAANVLDRPAWSPDGARIAFVRDDGVFVADGPGAATRLVTTANPRYAAWSPSGELLAYTAGAQIWVVPVDGSQPPRAVSPPAANVGAPSWSRQSDAVAYTDGRGTEIAYVDGHVVPLVSGPGIGAAFSPTGDFVAFAGPRPRCPGHVAIRIWFDNVFNGPVTGTCEIRGTSGADVIEGSDREGDVILAGRGNDRVHANDGHTDRVDCGPGRDTVWADRRDRLSGCEVVHR